MVNYLEINYIVDIQVAPHIKKIIKLRATYIILMYFYKKIFNVIYNAFIFVFQKNVS